MNVDDNPVHALTEDECWRFLHDHELGRLAFHLADEIHIVPINYAVDPTTTPPTLLFQTAPGEKLLAAVISGETAFEVDEVTEHRAVSVVVRGTARRLGEWEAHRAEELPLRPWVPTMKHEVVEIAPRVVTGRRFDLSRPWTHLRPE